MITIIRGSPISLLFYCEKSVMGRLGRYSQNHHFIVVIGPQNWFSLSPESYENELQTEYSRFFTDLHTIKIIQIPIGFRHTASPSLRPTVSSLGACPTPAP
jgi:hypothetical protein